MSHRLTVQHLGPVAQADLALGDLTILVGPQASGKSLLLQAFNAVEDLDAVVDALKRHGYHWEQSPSDLVELLFGEGMRGLVSPRTEIVVDGEPWDLTAEAQARWSKRGRKGSRVFYMPAQRVLTLQEGWPRPFTAFDVGVPFVVKQFSEDLRRLLEEGLGGDALFPAERRWKREIRELVSDAIFQGAKVKVDPSRLRKRIVLEVGADGDQLPFMSWSAGQREFIPLMLGLYWLMPTQATPRRQSIEWVIVEEPEMGLHPRAITALALALLDLLKRDYKVVLSTHSPHLLELVWAMNELRTHADFPDALCELFGVRPTAALREVGEAVLGKQTRVYALGHGAGGAVAKDISSLDPGHPDPDVAGWGGLTDFAERAGDVVARKAAAS
ncbi:MAG: AAA family ATPase [Myxococcota bacterium]